MRPTKVLITFLILLLTIVIALIIAYNSRPIQNEESISALMPMFVEVLEGPLIEEPDIPAVVIKPARQGDLIPRDRLLTQQEEIELHIQNAVSSYPNLTTNLISAIIWRESRYDPDATNYNGTCVGLMQISTKWHTKRAKKLGVTNLYDPYGNILTGCDLLSELLESHDLETALMMYHGGYSYAQKHQAAGTVDQYTKDILSYAKQLEEVT